MSVQTTSLQPWIHCNLYNQFPSVEDARNSISEECKIKIGKILGNFVPELIGQFGTTLTYGHHDLKENEFIIGELQKGKLVSKPKQRTVTVCPIAWVATAEALFATKAIVNASEKVLHLVKIIEKKANNILQHLPLESHEKFSKLSIAIDPRILCDTNKTYFVETNDKDISILTPQQKEEVDFSAEKIVSTYKSIDLPQVNKKNSET
ncbi:MAG: hypothetical protein ACRCSV_01780 [Chlamydiales bacterium]